MLTLLTLVSADDGSRFGQKAFCTCQGPHPVACARQPEQTHHLLVCHSLGRAGWQLYTLHEVFIIPQIGGKKKKNPRILQSVICEGI